MQQLVFAGSGDLGGRGGERRPRGSAGLRTVTQPRRTLAVLAVLLAHGAVLVLLSRAPPSRPATGEDNSPLTLWFLPLPAEAELPREENPGAKRQPRAAASHSNRRSPAAAPSQPPAARPIDWHDEASQAAAATLRARERAQRQAHALDRASGMDEGHGIGVLPFRWNSWRAHRLEALPGALLFHISERCVVAIMPFPLPVCALGKIAVHGDLFEHLKDTTTQRPAALP